MPPSGHNAHLPSRRSRGARRKAGGALALAACKVALRWHVFEQPLGIKRGGAFETLQRVQP